jgi:hypothetical protein
MQGWLAAAFCWSALPIGALGLLLLHRLVGGPWGNAVISLLRVANRTLPLFALAFLPVILAPSLIYAWAAPAAYQDPLIAAKAGYLNPPFFALRTVAYFAIWSTLALTIASESEQATSRPADLLVPALGLVVWSLTVSFAAVDWAMSVDPHFASSTFGLLVAVADLLAAFSFAVAVAAWWAQPAHTPDYSDGKVRNALAGLLTSGVLLWAYLAFMQYLVVWSGDLPHEAQWYLDRGAGGWPVVPWALGVFLGAAPVVALALPIVRRSWRAIAVVAGLIFVMRFVEAAWLVLPSFETRSWLQPVSWLTAMIGLAGVWVACLIWLLARDARRWRAAQAASHHG